MDICIWIVDGQELYPIDAQWLQDCGVKYVACQPYQLPQIVGACQPFDLKVVATWPDWNGLGLSTPEYAFRNYQGLMCAEDVPVSQGPSYWHPWANDYAALSIDDVAALGVDGLIICPRFGDNPFPRDWFSCDDDDWQYNAQFWSFDKWAQEAWTQYAGVPMPTHATVDGSFPQAFYRWYQRAWAERIVSLSEAAMDAGITDLMTWYIPCHSKTAENMALGSWDHAWAYDQWVNKVQHRGGKATVVATCLFASWVPERATNVQITRQLSADHGWSMLVGAEVCDDVSAVVPNFIVNARYAKQQGWGLFASGRYIFDRIVRRPLTHLLKELTERG